MRKAQILKNIENDIISSTEYKSEVDKSRPKFMATFPYAYMNGKLHLGHAFTMLKVDFEARWKAINNYNVLFPFGFHCTGMPIHAAAMKLKNEFDNNAIVSSNNKLTQYDIMKNSGIPENEIINFTDPYYWVKYFPNLGIDHIKKLGIMVDTRRSFVTTDINPFYDSFIKWQFNKLYEKNYLKFGTRNSIYSPSLNIQCQDHDRSKGESVQTSEFNIIQYEHDNKIFWIPYESNFDNQKLTVENIKISLNTEFIKCNINSQYIYMTKYIFDNYFEQYKCGEISDETYKFNETINNITVIKKHTNEYYNYLGGEIIFGNNNFNITKDKLCLSTDLVVDRLDKVCIVKPIPQWYIDYSNPEWKSKTLECIETMKLSDIIKNKLISTVHWLKEWGVSRTFGLGTKLPMDDKFIIDSLSDSTIYMAYYTIAHLLHNDIYGKESKYNPLDFTDKVWDYIFFKKWDDTITINRHDLDIMNESFEYFYPVDIRISGKDLISNHLTMYIFNHVAIFDKKHNPVSINCNGWISVNGEKMAKSKGNFITIESAVETNSVDAVRLTLAESGDGIDDANYNTKIVEDHNTLKLFNFLENMEKLATQEFEMGEYGILENMFNNIFNNILHETIDHYNNQKYKLVVSCGFHIYNNMREKYRIYCKYFNKQQNKKFVYEIIQKQLLIMYPIIPHISTYIFKKILNYNTIPILTNFDFSFDSNKVNRFNYIEDIINTVREKLDRLKKKKKPINKISISSMKLDDLEIKLINEQIKYEIEYIDIPENYNVVIT